MQAIDIMTQSVITAAPETLIEEIARTMLTHHVGAIPIVDDGKLVGIVSEGDLIRRPELGTERRRSRWVALFSSPAHLAAEYAHTHGRHAGDIMTRDVVTVADTTPIADIAGLLDKQGIKRLPVLRDGKLVGIVSRADLVRTLACRIASIATVDDRRIRDAVLAALRAQPWGGAPTVGQVMVRDGIVHLWGVYRSDDERHARVVAAETVPGVRGVEDHMDHVSPVDPLDRPNWPSPAPP